MTRHHLLVSDFDQTLSFNDSGRMLSEMLGIAGFDEKVAGLSRLNLVQEGAELTYLLRHDPEYRRVRREDLVAVGRTIRLKRNIALLAALLHDGLDELRCDFFVVSAAPEDIVLRAGDFVSLKDMTPVRGFFVSNRLGHLDEALAVANEPEGGTYPVGTLIQLVPQEAMVKRAPGFDAASDDWEFFSLSVSGTTTTIQARGVEDVENAFGGNCFQCHSQAEPEWDLICEDTHGCDPLQISDQIIMNLQDGDSRCN